MTATFMNAFYELFAHACGMHYHCLTSLCSNSGNVADGMEYNHVSAGLEYPRVADWRWIGTWKASQVGMI